MNVHIIRWAPATLLAGGVLLLSSLDAQRRPTLRGPLEAALPASAGGAEGLDVRLTEEEARALGATSYALRVYAPEEGGGSALASAYVAFYDRQTGGRTIHSPKNCLPGSGWEPLQSATAEVAFDQGENVRVNRYLIQRGDQRALVMYWYQGRGRVEASEYVVKWDLLRDAMLRRRSDEALVRVMVPITRSEAEASELALETSRRVIRGLEGALPL